MHRKDKDGITKSNLILKVTQQNKFKSNSNKTTTSFQFLKPSKNYINLIKLKNRNKTKTTISCIYLFFVN